jgi:O-antigen/teichoic acid export membrane protein
MSAVPASLERRALSLGSSNAFEYAMQFFVPVVLTRTIDANQFGEYRLLWLAVNALMLVLPMCMHNSLYYFVPRSDPARQRLYVNQTMLYLAVAGIVAAWALSLWNPLLPHKLEGVVSHHPAVVPAFAFAWIFASLLDVLPTADERVSWQAKATYALAAVRAIAVSVAAVATHALEPVLLALLACTGLKIALMLGYVATHHGVGGPVMRRDAIREQVTQSAPFALSSILHGVRGQGDQWIAAALFSVAQFASFSMAIVLGPLVLVFRRSVVQAFLPSMSRLQSAGEVQAMIGLNSRANAMVALLVYPILAFAFTFAEELITLVYTATYIDAAPVLRVYSIGLLAYVVELVSVLFVLRQGPFAAKVNAIVLLIALPLSLLGAMRWGLVGAALGSVVAVYVERVISLQRISRLTGMRVAALQDWGAIAGILGAAAISAAAAGAFLSNFDWPPLVTLAAGGLVVALLYPAALYVTGQARQLADFFASLRAARA